MVRVEVRLKVWVLMFGFSGLVFDIVTVSTTS